MRSPNAICCWCGSEYYVQPHRLIGTKYCSRSCKSKANAKKRKPIDNRVCITCGKTFHKSDSELRASAGKYCSKECYSKRQGEFITGVNHPRWKGGIRNERYYNYKIPAEKRGLEFALTEAEFFSFWQQPCHYCGSEIDTIGLDRVDNTQGYTIDNIVSCCEICNRMKLALGHDVFINHIYKIIDKQQRKISTKSQGEGCIFWHFVNIYGTELGNNVKIGSFTEVGPAVIGNNVTIGAQCFIPEKVTIQDDVWIGPRVCFTNDFYPPSGKENWKPTLVKKGASIGANATIICGVTIGENAFVAAGAVVTKDIPDNEMCMGVPALVKGGRKYA